MLAATESSELYHNLGNSLHMIPGRDSEATAAYAKAVEMDPGNANARHMLAVLSGDALDTIPADYVAGLFNGYASFYDTDLIGKLQYRVPGLIRKALVKVKPGRAHFPAVLDIGCGTGLT